MLTFKYNLSATVQGGGPSVNVPGSFEIEAYDNVKVKVASTGQDETINIIPGNWGNVNFIIINSSQFDDTGKLKYGFVTPAGINLNRAQFVIAPLAAKLAGE